VKKKTNKNAGRGEKKMGEKEEGKIKS